MAPSAPPRFYPFVDRMEKCIVDGRVEGRSEAVHNVPTP
jgi:hypothetical protein